ncbi:HelD family protein [Bifidobacterium bombi]|uniref:DNA/RNA helicase, family I n=1 Tax=Bifidobacterium bombi DSM 19703 TaxID=1341695 RepID=A0A080N2Q3_9BIFI|nr:AAA family ATPase [Bifidobacterium bombi]KFF31282.1 DNA/RNA helicase, family I [Bifidobacterium bombi DSM 19703]
MPNCSSQIHEEQVAVTHAYQRLDALRDETRTRLNAVRAAGAHGSPTMRTERDSFATMYEDRLTQLRAVEDRLIFGRLDNASGEQRYIGRIGLSDEGHNPLLTDWRADAARPFYEATPKHHGDTVMRRHITLRFREVIGVEDEVLDVHSSQVNQAQQSGTLTGEGALMASLDSRRTGKMTDIVSTIQAEQDRIIRSPLDRAVVVQGGPGTGKTAVALHRAAYLLYTYRRKLQNSGVLIIGPSNQFLRYIDQVLPSLGETGVVSRTIGTLLPGIRTTLQDNPQAARLKGQKRMATAIANAVAERERIPASLPSVKINGFTIALKTADVEQAIDDARHARQPHNTARTTFVKSALHTMRLHYVEQLDYEPGHDEITDVDNQLKLDDDLRKTLNLCWLPMQATWLVDQMFSKPQQLRRFAPWLSDREIEVLVRPKGSPLTISDIPLIDEAMELLGPDPRQAAKDAAAKAQRKEEEKFAAETLAQTGLGSGIITSSMLVDNINGTDPEAVAQQASSDREWAYGHVVVDEAQELTAMDWRMLLRRCPSRSFTVVGDVAQTASLGGTRHWEQTMTRLFGEEGWDLNELTINYRNPKQVSNLASAFAKSEGLYISTTKAVRDIPNAVERREYDDVKDLLDDIPNITAGLFDEFLSDDDGMGLVAIIAPNQLLESVTARLKDNEILGNRKSAYSNENGGPTLDERIVICDTQSVKGLEYDAAVLIQPGLMEEEAASRQSAASDIYVAMTRPTQKLIIAQSLEDKANVSL